MVMLDGSGRQLCHSGNGHKTMRATLLAAGLAALLALASALGWGQAAADTFTPPAPTSELRVLSHKL